MEVKDIERIVFKESVLYPLLFVILLWMIKYTEYAFSVDLSNLGIYPRTLQGSIGILTSPFIHGDFYHLFSNTFPLIFAGMGVFYFYRRIAFPLIVIIYLASGIWVWLFARSAYHIGASGIIYGLVSFLFFSGIFRKDLPSISVSLIVIFLYNGMIHGLFPLEEGISWESHLTGAVIGFMSAYYFKDTKAAVVPVEQDDDDELDSEHDNNYSDDHTHDDHEVEIIYHFKPTRKK
jgi:membrane associated rhomboid family serine protease